MLTSVGILQIQPSASVCLYTNITDLSQILHFENWFNIKKPLAMISYQSLLQSVDVTRTVLWFGPWIGCSPPCSSVFSHCLPGTHVDLFPVHVSFGNIFKSESRPSLIFFPFLNWNYSSCLESQSVFILCTRAYPSQVSVNKNVSHALQVGTT